METNGRWLNDGCSCVIKSFYEYHASRVLARYLIILGFMNIWWILNVSLFGFTPHLYSLGHEFANGYLLSQLMASATHAYLNSSERVSPRREGLLGCWAKNKLIFLLSYGLNWNNYKWAPKRLWRYNNNIRTIMANNYSEFFSNIRGDEIGNLQFRREVERLWVVRLFLIWGCENMIKVIEQRARRCNDFWFAVQILRLRFAVVYITLFSNIYFIFLF
jgi:hypothetical protein